MADRPARKQRPVNRAEVVRAERLTPHMVRVVLGGEGLAGFGAGEYTDHYIKILFPQPGVTYPEPFDMAQIREDFPRDQWPVTRTYTIRRWDAELRELTVDFVVHGDEGLAGPWADKAEPGDTVLFMGPGGAYAPDPEADWHLLAGDESALPAIAAALERMPEGAQVHCFIEVEDRDERQPLTAPAGADVTWLFRNGVPVGTALVEAVRTLDFPAGQVHAFVHGEAGMVKELRRMLRVEREIPREQLSISGYWRLGHNEDGWQSSKKEWNAQVEAEQEGVAA
ncbi:siderophore-interacting protein [Streptomyces boninensis]|uniref:siderophore-interacting protein n=1 Tax=Streptomyces boninensis TaxID=2039455 RepID=UPI003B20B67A